MRATISLQGLLILAPHLLDNLMLPEGVNPGTVKQNIILESMDLELLYPNPTYMASAIKNWSLMQLPVWEHLWKTTQYEYNPINNYDRIETRTWSEDRTKDEDVTRKENVNETGSRESGYNDSSQTTSTGSKDSTSNTTGSTTDSTETKRTTTTDKAAFNSSSYEPVDQVQENLDQFHDNAVTGKVENNETSSQTDSKTGSGSEHSSDSRLETIDTNQGTNETENIEHTETAQVHGNIGAMSTQQMIEQEREIAQFNLTQLIVNQFIERFCLLVY